jgi:hypothetical protein
MDSWNDPNDTLLARLVATWSGSFVALVLLVSTLLAVVWSRRAGWSAASSLLLVALGLGVTAETRSVSHYLASLFLASRCAGFVTLKYINLAPVRWLLWPAWGALALSACMSARDAWNRRGAERAGRAFAKALCAVLGVAAMLGALRKLDERLDEATAGFRSDYYHERSRFQPCMRPGGAP